MRIVVLDGYALNPGDLSWSGLEELGELTVHDRTPDDLIVERSAGAEMLLTNKAPLSAQSIHQLPNLRYIGVLATGYNMIDVEAAVQSEVTVTNVPAYATTSVAQMVFALLLELTNHVQAHGDAVRAGEWSQCPDFCFWKSPQIELMGKTMGIIGFGRIGRQVARIAGAMGMRIVAADAIKKNPPALEDFAWADIPELLAAADVVSLHCPQIPETEALMNRRTIGLMKRSAFLINTSRGGLVVDEDLAEALNSDHIAGAGLDVLSTEPPAADNPLLSAKNCLITPHIAWASKEARARLLGIAIQNIEAFIAGRPVNVVTA